MFQGTAVQKQLTLLMSSQPIKHLSELNPVFEAYFFNF